MNRKQVIKQIKLLKTLQPTQSVLDDMKEIVFQEVGVAHKDSFRFNLQSYRVTAYGIAVAVFLIIFLSIFSIIPNQVHSIMMYGKLTFASNQYEKATLALADTIGRFGNKSIKVNNVQALSQSLALTNTELSDLKLKGEKGKYTAQECHAVYQQYLNYLQKEYIATPQSFSTLKSQIFVYQEQAEQKLHMYHNL